MNRQWPETRGGGQVPEIESGWLRGDDGLRAAIVAVTAEMESDSRYDDRPCECRNASDRKTRWGHRVAGLATDGMDARLHMRQVSHVSRQRLGGVTAHRGTNG